MMFARVYSSLSAAEILGRLNARGKRLLAYLRQRYRRPS